MMKTLVNFLAFFGVLFFSGCDGSNGYDYDSGYEDAWEEKEESSWFTSKEYRAGYEQGQIDTRVYYIGYEDGYDGRRTKYTNDLDYMDGFKDGKEDKKRGF